MKKILDLRIAGAITVLSFGLVHCSSEPAASTGVGPSAGAPVAAAGSDAGPAGGSAPLGTSGSSTAGGSDAGSTGGVATGRAGTGGAETTSSGAGGMLEGVAGAGSSGGTMTGTAGAANGSCGGNASVCEDFEAYPAASAPAGGWTVALRGNGKIVVDTTRAFGGKQSLHVTGKMSQDHANISRPIQDAAPIAYVRLMYFGTSYPASSGVHTRLARLGTKDAASGNPYTSYSLASYNGTAIERVNSIYLRDTRTKLDDPKLLNRWACLEFMVDMSGGVGNVKVHIWVDSKELTLSPAGSASHGMTKDSWDPLAFEVFMLGLDGYQDDPQLADYWIDDVSVTPQRLGCKAAG